MIHQKHKSSITRYGGVDIVADQHLVENNRDPRDTRLSMEEISERRGFSMAICLATAFRKRMGITTSACRKQMNGPYR